MEFEIELHPAEGETFESCESYTREIRLIARGDSAVVVTAETCETGQLFVPTHANNGVDWQRRRRPRGGRKHKRPTPPSVADPTCTTRSSSSLSVSFPSTPRIYRLSPPSQTPILRLDANGTAGMRDENVLLLRTGLNCLDPTGALARETNLRELAGQPHAVPSLLMSLPAALCQDCKPVAYAAVGLNAMIQETSWEKFMPKPIPADQACRCVRLTTPTTAREECFQVTLSYPGPNDKCQAVLMSENRTRMTCSFGRQPVGLYTSQSDKPVFYCKDHYELARRHGLCICGVFPKVLAQRDVLTCGNGHVYHRGCTAERGGCPHMRCLMAPVSPIKLHPQYRSPSGNNHYSSGGSRMFYPSALLLTVALIGLLITPLSALTMTACDCRAPQLVGAIDLGKVRTCGAERAANSTEVQYRVIEHNPIDFTFGGYACRSWKRTIKVETFWTSNTDTSTSEHPVLLSDQDCWRMIQTKTCDGQPMSVSGSIWTFEKEPRAEWRYLRTIEDSVINCIVEPVTLDQPRNTDAVLSVGGKLAESRAAGHAVRHGTTYVWDTAPHGKSKTCEYSQISEGIGQLFPADADTGQPDRLRDAVNQLDFSLGNQTTLCGKSSVFRVQDDDNVFIQYTDLLHSDLSRGAPKFPQIDFNRTDRAGYLLHFHTRAHFQFYESLNVDRFNQLADHLHQKDCEMSELKKRLLVVVSRFSSVRAAQMVNQPECYGLVSYGPTGILSRCKKVNVTFCAVSSRCGFQPVTPDNFTIDKDGKTLKAYSPCYWQDSFANFDGVVHEYDTITKDWKPVKPTFTSSRIRWRSHFNATVDHEDPRETLALLDDPSAAMSLLGELSALVYDKGAESVGDFLQSSVDQTKSRHMFSFLNIIYWVGSVVCAILLFAGIAATFYLLEKRCYLFSGLWKQCAERVTPSHTIRPSAPSAVDSLEMLDVNTHQSTPPVSVSSMNDQPSYQKLYPETADKAAGTDRPAPLRS